MVNDDIKRFQAEACCPLVNEEHMVDYVPTVAVEAATARSRAALRDQIRSTYWTGK